MKAVLIVAGLALAGSATAQETARPYQPTAQCLSAIMTARNETLDIMDPTIANEAYGVLWDLTVRLIAAENDVVKTVTEYLTEVKGMVADGSVPPGSVEVERDRYAKEASYEPLSAASRRRQMFPDCQWPEGSIQTVGARIRAISIN